MIILGLVSNKSNHGSFNEYIIGNRSLGAIVVAFSYLASEISIGTFTVAVAMIYKSGLSRIWMDFGFLLFTILCWQLIAKRLRIDSEKAGNAITIPQYLANKFESDLLGVITAIVIVFFTTIYIAANLLGFAKIIGAIFEIPQFICYGIGFLIIIIYVVMGGFKATCYTDVAQGIIMLFASIILPAVLYYKFGFESLSSAVEMKSHIIKSTDFTHILLYAGFSLWLFGSPHTLTRFMAINSVKNIDRARNIAIILNIIMYAGILVSALYSIVIFKQVNDPEIILFKLSQLFLHPLVGGFVVTAMIAAMMSTVDSQLAVCSSCLTNDVYKKFVTTVQNDAKLINVTRITTVIVGIVAIFIVAFYDESVLKLAVFAITGLGTSLGPIIVFSLYMKNLNSTSAIIGVCSGCFLTILCSFSPNIKDLHYNLFPIFCISSFSILISAYFNKTKLASVKS